MNKKSDYAILLTACVNPNGMIYTKLQDPGLRISQYIEAIRFYISNTDVPIVFCENTNTDISHLFPEEITNGRLECITFDGNNYNKERGKGYGEGMIIIHAIQNSTILKARKQIIKITGRLIISNISRIITSPINKLPGICRCNIENPEYFRTMIFIFDKTSFFSYLVSHLDLISDSSFPPVAIENIVANYVKETNIPFIPFIVNPNIKGIGGMTGLPYANKPNITNLIDNICHLQNILRYDTNIFIRISLKLSFLTLAALNKLIGGNRCKKYS